VITSSFKRFSLSILILILFLFSGSFLLSGCGGGGGGGGGGGVTTNSYTYTVSGTIYGGYNILSSSSYEVELYQLGETNPLITTYTNLGQYSFSYTTSNSTVPLFYVVVPGIQNYQNKTNTLEAVSTIYGSNIGLNANELTTAEAGYATNQVGGSVNTNGSLNIPGGQTSQFLSDLSLNAGDTLEIYNIANALASCIQSDSSIRAQEACSSVIIALPAYISGEGQFAIDAAENYQSLQVPLTGASYQMIYETPWSLNQVSSSASSNILPLYWSNNENRLYTTVDINGQPFNLLVDTGATGINVNQSDLQNAGINIIPTRFLFTASFGSPEWVTFSGFVALVNLTLPNGITVNNFPISISTSCSPTIPSDTTHCNSLVTGVSYQNVDGAGIHGDLGLGLSPYGSFGFNGSNGQETAFTPSIIFALPDNMNNGFILSLNQDSNLTSDGYDFVTGGESAGSLILGLNTESNNSVSGGTFYPSSKKKLNNFPEIPSEFGGYITDTSGYPFYSIFDTGNPFIDLGNNALTYAMPNDGQYTNCPGLPQDLMLGDLAVTYGLLSGSGSYSSLNAFTYTSPYIIDSTTGEYDFCNISIPSGDGIIAENVFTYSKNSANGFEQFGLPIMFNQTMFWSSPYNTQYGWGIGVAP
jgi:hypothetical protein